MLQGSGYVGIGLIPDEGKMVVRVVNMEVHTIPMYVASLFISASIEWAYFYCISNGIFGKGVDGRG